MTDPGCSSSPGTHDVGVERRFSDLDALGHVNNVRYLDHLDEGLAGWLEWHDVPRGAVRVRAHRMGFLQPMAFGRDVVEVRTGVVGVDDDVVHVAQHVATVPSPRRPEDRGTVHLRSESWLEVSDLDSLRELQGYADPARAHAWRDVPAAELPHRHVHAVTVRARDVGADGLVRPDAVVEYFQEARVHYLADLHSSGEDWAMIVLARTDVELRGDVHGDEPAVEVRSWIAHLGRSSFTIRADLVGEDGPRATSTVVAVCVSAEDQRPVPVTPAQRTRLEGELSG